MWSLPNLLRLVIASAAVELRAVSHAASLDCSLDVVARVPRAANRFRLAVVTHARATGREWHDIAQRIGDRDPRSLARDIGDDVRRLQREVLFPQRAGGETACPEWWGLPSGMEAPERLLHQLDAHAALVGAPLVSSRLEAPRSGTLDSAVALLEQLHVDIAAHRLTVLYGGSGASESPLPLGVTEQDVIDQLGRYRAEADRLSAEA